jgi:hypothetical protein
MKKGAGVAQGGNGFHEWFHGVITRKIAEVRQRHIPCYLSVGNVSFFLEGSPS